MVESSAPPEPTSALADEIGAVLLARLASLAIATPRRIACVGVTAPAALRTRYPDAVWANVAVASLVQMRTLFTPLPQGEGCPDTNPRPPSAATPFEKGAEHGSPSQEYIHSDQSGSNGAAADLVLGMPGTTPYTPTMFHDIKNALADGGVFLFATLGPQTLLPLQPLCSSLTTPHDFASWPTLVDLGDALVAAGLAKPVLDREILTFTYDTADAALAELARDGWFDAARGAASCTAEAARALTADDGSAAVPFEILYGVAWNTAPAAWQPLHFLR